MADPCMVSMPCPDAPGPDELQRFNGLVDPGGRVGVSETFKFDVVQRVKTHYQQHHRVIDVDGARILFANGWGLVRASNTQDVLVLRFEADSETDLDRIRSQVEEQVAKTIDSLNQ